ncbi:MAG: hypothetical protein COB02_02060 [Candidatus Cloacimonadota bacterium]|nr:MAG: hypothetical protein COB02_02060 [Candidatus Cloacimonadota bacterium]
MNHLKKVVLLVLLSVSTYHCNDSMKLKAFDKIYQKKVLKIEGPISKIKTKTSIDIKRVGIDVVLSYILNPNKIKFLIKKESLKIPKVSLKFKNIPFQLLFEVVSRSIKKVFYDKEKDLYIFTV